uniref:Uncharacterized protein n=1 Tax=Timema douglasi TaxID=61478 RepID=A0A7R8VVZ0_TIMDO|nr:unnamed protein product [Timema douglasi]
MSILLTITALVVKQGTSVGNHRNQHSHVIYAAAVKLYNSPSQTQLTHSGTTTIRHTHRSTVNVELARGPRFAASRVG